jgi:predicted dehydrogenase
MPEKIAWGILGTATIARKCVIPAMQASTKCRVHVIGSREPRAAVGLAREHGIDKVAEGYDAVINDPTVKAVYIPLPNHLHCQWALKAFNAGKHVLCEKPLALDAREAEQMAAAAKDCGRLLMEGFMYRFHPRSRRIHDMLAQGHVGTLQLVRAAFCYRMEKALIDSGDNFRLHPDTGGGALLDVGCYGVSAARWYFGAEPTAVQAQAVYHPNGVDMHLVGNLKFKHGGLAVVEASFVSALQQTYTLAGDRAVIELPHDAYIPWEKDALFSIRQVDQETGQWFKVDGEDEYRLMVDHFVDAINNQAPLAYRPADSIANMRVLDALAQAARSGKSLRLASNEEH